MENKTKNVKKIFCWYLPSNMEEWYNFILFFFLFFLILSTERYIQNSLHSTTHIYYIYLFIYLIFFFQTRISFNPFFYIWLLLLYIYVVMSSGCSNYSNFRTDSKNKIMVNISRFSYYVIHICVFAYVCFLKTLVLLRLSACYYELCRVFFVCDLLQCAQVHIKYCICACVGLCTADQVMKKNIKGVNETKCDTSCLIDTVALYVFVCIQDVHLNECRKLSGDSSHPK